MKRGRPLLQESFGADQGAAHAAHVGTEDLFHRGIFKRRDREYGEGRRYVFVGWG